MNDVSDHEATMRFLYGYVVRKTIARAGGSEKKPRKLVITKKI